MLLLLQQNLSVEAQQDEPQPTPPPAQTFGPWGGRRARRLPNVETETSGLWLSLEIGSSSPAVASAPKRAALRQATDAATASLTVGSCTVSVAARRDLEAETVGAQVIAHAGSCSVVVDRPARRVDTLGAGLSASAGHSAVRRRRFVSPARMSSPAKRRRLGDAA